MKGFIEMEVAGMTFRTRRERTLLAECQLEKIFFRDGSIGAHDMIKVDCEIFDRKNQEWIAVTDKDLEGISRSEGKEKLTDVLTELRKKEKDFQKTQPKSEKKQEEESGHSKTG